MELNYNFESILETLFAKFSLPKEEIYLYVLAAIARHYRIGLQFFDIFNHKTLNEVENYMFSENTLLEIKEEARNPTSFKDKKRIYHQKLSKLLIQDYLQSSKLRNEYFLEPQSLTKFLIELAEPKPRQIVYNPNCGIGFSFIELYKKFPEYDFEFIGHANYKIGFLCKMNLFANDVRTSTDIIPFNPLKFDKEAEIEIDFEVNLAITIPPFGSGSFSIADYIELMLTALDEKGKAVVVVPDSFLVKAESKSLRKEYLSRNLIEKIISLPDSLFKPHSLIKTSIIVLNKSNPNNNFIVFDGKESDKFETTQVNVNEILQTNNYDLQVSRYALKEGKEVASILSNYPSNQVKKIKDLITLSISGYNYSPNQRNIENSLETLPYVRVADLSKNETEFNLDVTKVERKISREKAHNKTIIDFSCVLVSKISPKLKPTYFNFTGQPIVIGSDVVALKLKEDINVDYFLTQLYSRLVKIQVEMMSSGTTINRISTEDFLNIQIILPPLEEQSSVVIEFLKKFQKELIEDVAQVEKEVKNTEYDIIGIAIHDFNQKLGAMQNDLSDLKQFFEEKLPDYLSQPIKPVYDDDTEEEINQFRLGNVLQRLINTRNEAFAQLSATREELQNNTVKPVIIKNLKRWFEKEVKPLYQNEIDFEVSGEKIEAEIDPNRFKNLVRNLVVNAKQHNAKIVAFDVSYSYLDGEKKIRILYKNDGEPFPEDFNFDVHFKGLYQKSSQSKGTGIGGYSVNKTIELHNGEMKNISPEITSGELFPVQIEIILPINYKPNPNYVKSNPYSLN